MDVSLVDLYFRSRNGRPGTLVAKKPGESSPTAKQGVLTRGSHPAQTRPPRAVVAEWGGHATSTTGLDLDRDEDVFRWFVLACLLHRRAGEPAANRAFEALRAVGLDAVDALAAGPDAAAAALEASGFRDPERAARMLARASASLGMEYGGSLASLAGASDDVWGLMARLSQLAPGVGRATVCAFLRPLRDRWPAAIETPLTPAARSAAMDLGWLAEGEDEEGEPGALRRLLAEAEEAPPLADVEAALERLGRKA